MFSGCLALHMEQPLKKCASHKGDALLKKGLLIHSAGLPYE